VLSLAPRAAQAADAFDGSERVGRLLPRWVAEAALRGRLPHLPQLKCAFVLYPAEVRRRVACSTSTCTQPALHAPCAARQGVPEFLPAGRHGRPVSVCSAQLHVGPGCQQCVFLCESVIYLYLALLTAGVLRN